MVLDLDTVSLAARFDSGVSFLELLGPLRRDADARVSIPKKRLHEALAKLGVDATSEAAGRLDAARTPVVSGRSDRRPVEPASGARRSIA